MPTLTLFVCSVLTAASAQPQPVSFRYQVRPILSDRCFACHGPDASHRKAGLRLDLQEQAHGPLAEGKGRAIVPGHPEQSVAFQRMISHDPDEVMPPPKAKMTVTEEEIDLVRRWIKEGAVYEPHWAFLPPPASVPAPAVKKTDWPRDDIDRHVLARLEQEGLAPSPEADRARWIRRVTFDLTGLPPTPAEVDAFLADTSPAAHETVVDRLLASPRYGEHMAVPWLDAARYADSFGYQSDLLTTSWPYRDWVVRAFNDNMPFDRFATLQLAGDLLPEAGREEILPTAFNRLHRMTNEGGSIREEFRTEYAADRTATFGTVFLGLTLECARCHDHKYDPVSARDYFSLFAFFNSINEEGLYSKTEIVPTPALPLPTPQQEERLAAARKALAEEEAREAERERAMTPRFDAWLAANPTPPPDHTGLAAAFAFEVWNGNATTNAVDGKATLRRGAGTKEVDGPSGRAIQVDGDNELFIDEAWPFNRWDPFTWAMWIRPAIQDGQARVLMHRSDGTDVGFSGVDLLLQDGRLTGRLMRHWPGNASAVRTRESIASNAWTHVAFTADGSSSAGGLRIFINGKPATTDVLADGMFKDLDIGKGIRGGGTHQFGARFRDLGFTGGAVDDLRIYSRRLAPLEITRLAGDTNAWTAAFARPAEHAAVLREVFQLAVDPERIAGQRALDLARMAVIQAENPVHEVMVMRDTPEPAPAYVLERGAYDAPRTEDRRVTRATPAFLPPLPAGEPLNRLGLARWLLRPDHPLTARVTVNRIWQQFFGAGLVDTPENFGMQGGLPSHPELLDHLARSFIEGGWNIKALCRRIVLSATYRQDSRATAALRERDPANRLLARGPSGRLAAESIRDLALQAAGVLDTTAGGPPVSPYQPGGDLWRESNSMSPGYHQSTGTALYRRSLYSVRKRTAPLPNMLLFDAPSRESCVVRRAPTSSPLQGLVLMNDVQFVEAARLIATRAMREAAEGTPAARITLGFRHLAGRAPTDAERAILETVYAEQKQLFDSGASDAPALLKNGTTPAPADIPPADLAALTLVMQTLLNLDDTIWKR
jgi:hypothetical protein